MLRISKLTDYGAVIMSHLARYPNEARSAADIAQSTHVPLPMTSKILKQLARHNLLISQRGSQGGYILAKEANDISLVDIVDALDGKVGITECAQVLGQCFLEKDCRMRSNWSLINHVLQKLLADISLAALADAKLTKEKLVEQLQNSLLK